MPITKEQVECWNNKQRMKAATGFELEYLELWDRTRLIDKKIDKNEKNHKHQS